jgi:magnesium transporter
MASHNPLSLDFLAHRAPAAATVIQGLDPADAGAWLEDIPVRLLAPVFTAMDAWPAARVLQKMSGDRAAALLAGLPYRDTAALLRLQEPARQRAMLEDLPGRLANNLKRTLSYQENTVGAWMDMSTPYFRDNLSAGDCLELLARENEPFGAALVVVDESRRNVGLVGVDALLVSPADRLLAELADPEVPAIAADLSLRQAGALASWNHYTLLPVRGRNRAHLGTLSRQALNRGLARTRPPSAPVNRSLFAHLAGALVITCTGLFQLGANGNYDRPPGDNNDT